jgi:hypothetical protein
MGCYLMAKYVLSVGNLKRCIVWDTDKNPLFKIERLDGGSNDFASKGIIADALGAFTPVTAGGTGSGDVTGPSSATANAFARFDGTTGKAIKNSGVVCDNSNNVTGMATAQIASYKLIAHGNATLVSGTVSVSLAAINSGALVILTRKTTGTSPGILTYTITASTGFDIVSDDALDDAVITYQVWNGP